MVPLIKLQKLSVTGGIAVLEIAKLGKPQLVINKSVLQSYYIFQSHIQLGMHFLLKDNNHCLRPDVILGHLKQVRAKNTSKAIDCLSIQLHFALSNVLRVCK